MRKIFFCTLAVALLFALPGFARVNTIERGIDVWYTPGDGTTFVDFSKIPIPKGFFCSGSAPFTGKVVLRGRPLATGVPGELGGADTIVQRFDDASFDKSGVATTRIQLRALQMEGVAPIKTSCGDYHVRVVLNGKQQTTRMRIIREGEVSGRFEAPIRVNFKMTFQPLNAASPRPLELFHSFQLQPAANATWATVTKKRPASNASTVVVDTNGDHVPDTYLPKTSGNFLAGMSPERIRQLAAARDRQNKTLEREITEVTTCSDTQTISYTGYGDYGCHTGADPDCHPHTEATGVHCSQACEPCFYTVALEP